MAPAPVMDSKTLTILPAENGLMKKTQTIVPKSVDAPILVVNGGSLMSSVSIVFFSYFHFNVIRVNLTFVCYKMITPIPQAITTIKKETPQLQPITVSSNVSEVDYTNMNIPSDMIKALKKQQRMIKNRFLLQIFIYYVYIYKLYLK